MMKFVYLILIFIFTLSCQLSPKSNAKREVAGLDILSSLISKVAKSSLTKEVIVEHKILHHLKNNLSQKELKTLGINSDELMGISLKRQTLPFRERLAHLIARDLKDIFSNLSSFQTKQITSKLEKEFSHSVKSKIHQRNNLIFEKRQLQSVIKTMNEKKNKKVLLDLTNTLPKRSSKNAQSIKTIIQSAYKISIQTGRKPAGKSCQDFLDFAPTDVLEKKAMVDMIRANNIETLALKKNRNIAFNHYSEVPKKLRVTKKEIDEATKKAIIEVYSIAPKQASVVLKKLKSSPCKIY